MRKTQHATQALLEWEFDAAQAAPPRLPVTFVSSDWSSVINTARCRGRKSIYCFQHRCIASLCILIQLCVLLRVLGFSVSYVNLLFAYEWSAVVWLKFHAHTTMMKCTVFDARPICKILFFFFSSFSCISFQHSLIMALHFTHINTRTWTVQSATDTIYDLCCDQGGNET